MAMTSQEAGRLGGLARAGKYKGRGPKGGARRTNLAKKIRAFKELNRMVKSPSPFDWGSKSAIVSRLKNRLGVTKLKANSLFKQWGKSVRGTEKGAIGPKTKLPNPRIFIKSGGR